MKKLISTLFLITIVFTIHSQEILIHKTDGTILSINLDDIDSLTFVSDS